MVTIELTSFEDVRRARERVGRLARAAGFADPEAAVMAVGELGNNCVEHGGEGPGLLRVKSGPGRLSLQFENPCRQRPTWQTSKPVAVEEFREGGYGLLLVRSVARQVRTSWHQGRAVVRAEFAAGRHPVKGSSSGLAAGGSRRDGGRAARSGTRGVQHVARSTRPGTDGPFPSLLRDASRQTRAGA